MKIDVGSVVLSIAGRDKGRYYVVIEVISDDYVKISDGDLRPQERAKLKNRRHLKPNGDILTKISEKINAQKQVFDSEIRSALHIYNEHNNKEEQ